MVSAQLNIPQRPYQSYGQETQTRTIRLNDGQLIQITTQTQQRLLQQGVDINNLANMSPFDLQRLGIAVRSQATPVGSLTGLPIQPRGLEIRLKSGVILEIDQATLRRLESQGVNINNIPNMSDAELAALGLRVREETFIIPGAIQISGGVQELRLPSGAVLVITSQQIQQLKSQGINLNTLSQLSEAELRRLGLQVRGSSFPLIPGSNPRPGGGLEIRLKSGVVLEIDQATLRRLETQGVNINNIPNMSDAELRALGLVVTPDFGSTAGFPANPILIPGSIPRPGGGLQIKLKSGVTLEIDQATLRRLQTQGVNLNNIPNMSDAELRALGLTVTPDFGGSSPFAPSNPFAPTGPILIPGAISRPGGGLEIKLKSGVTLEIDQATLRRLQTQGVNLNNIPNMSDAELRALGLTVRPDFGGSSPFAPSNPFAPTGPILIPGSTPRPGGGLEIRLKSGVILEIDQATLRRLQTQGVNLNR